ncbi:MAG: SDR family oxidoreductase [Deltaproteobacteria bacterium]|nr:SDR family oxidoreductase [Deltaproteobacteria bacterium]
MNLSLDEIRRLTQYLEALDKDRTLLTHLPEAERVALLTAVGRVGMPERSSIHRLKKAVRRQRGEKKREHDKGLRDQTGIREARTQTVFEAPAPVFKSAEEHPERLLKVPVDCYVCKQEYRRVHHFYDSMCWSCGEFNYQKRFQKVDLAGQVALITGARVKIGFQASLMLLRSGAQVIATTRFPIDATERYAKEADFNDWKDRLHVHGLDLRHAPSVELLAHHVATHFPRLDIIINNAAQTVRRPPGWYRHLLESEQRALPTLPKDAQRMLESHAQCLKALHPEEHRWRLEESAASERAHAVHEAAAHGQLPNWRSHDPGLGIHSSAALSLVPYDLEQSGDEALVFFPEGKLDADLQQVDLRDINTWRLTLSQVATAEMLEVYLVNAVAPFVLNGKLKGLMERDRTKPGHIVNVSAMEGSFSRGTKTDKHPHTNMAKAALNMMTLTSAPDYRKSNIFMNAVDTGWVTDEDPMQHAMRKAKERDFSPPLDIVDGAARVIDPVFESVRSGECVSGLFFKDYRPTRW